MKIRPTRKGGVAAAGTLAASGLVASALATAPAAGASPGAAAAPAAAADQAVPTMDSTIKGAKLRTLGGNAGSSFPGNDYGIVRYSSAPEDTQGGVTGAGGFQRAGAVPCSDDPQREGVSWSDHGTDVRVPTTSSRIGHPLRLTSPLTVLTRCR